MTLSFNGANIGGTNSGGGSGGDVGNGKITINQGGVKKGDFTVNQASNTTIDLDGGSSITVDSSMSDSSENPVQNKVITAALSDKQNSSTAVTHTASTAVGSTTKGAYIAADGTATEMTYSVEKDVPSNAVFTDTTYSNFTGADGINAGSSGLVPAPAATDNTNFLKGDGTWGTDPNFLPSGTTINIKTDGTGDFTDLASAKNYLTGKWSNGTVTIQFGSGTFNLNTGVTFDGSLFSIPYLVITGAGINDTTVQKSSSWGATDYSSLITIYRGNVYMVKDITLQGTGQASSAVTSSRGANVFLSNIHAKNLYRIVDASQGGYIGTSESVLGTDLAQGMMASTGGRIGLRGSLTVNNSYSATTVQEGGIIQIGGCTGSFTSVTMTYQPSQNQLSASGLILGQFS